MADEKLSARTETTTSTSGFLHIIKSLTSFKISIVNLFKTTEAVTFGGQAHAASYTEAFSATREFNANNGTNQEMPVSADTVLSLINDVPGTYNFRLKITAGGVTSIAVGASFGTKLTNTSADFDYTNGVVNILTLVHWKSGDKDYTISN